MADVREKLAELAKSKRHKDVEIVVPAAPPKPKKVKRTGPSRPDEYLNEAALEREAATSTPRAGAEAGTGGEAMVDVAEVSAVAHQSSGRLALVEETPVKASAKEKASPPAAEPVEPPAPVRSAAQSPAKARPVEGASVSQTRQPLEEILSARAQEAAALTRVLKSDVGYYQTLWELRDGDDTVALPHSAYASLFDVRIGAIAPLFARLQESGALQIVREYDRRTQTTWAYRMNRPNVLAASAPPVKAP